MTVPGFSPSCRHGLYRAQARCACARRGICLAADRFAATNRPTQSGTAASPQSPRGLGPRSRSTLRSMSPLGSSLRAALTPAPTGETCHWHLSPAGRLSQRVGAASLDGFHRSPSPAAPQLLLTNHGGPLNESSRGPPWLRVAALRGCKMYERTHERAFGTFAAPFDLALRGLLADCCAASAT